LDERPLDVASSTIMADGMAAVRVPLRPPAHLPAPVRLLLAPAGPLAAWLRKLAEVQIVDRGVALGALAFSALFPLMIVYGALVPFGDAQNFAANLVHRLHLRDGAAETVKSAIAPPSAIAGSITVIGILLVLSSGLSLARGLQRLYEVSYRLPSMGVRGTPWHLLWIVLLPLYFSLRAPLVEVGGPVWHLAGSLALGALVWLATPYVLLARRMSWRDLLPGALLTSASMTVFGYFSAIYLPHSVSTSAGRFGAIGIAFALLSWLVLAGFVLVGAAAAGAVARQWRQERG
jgi:membrane protein